MSVRTTPSAARLADVEDRIDRVLRLSNVYPRETFGIRNGRAPKLTGATVAACFRCDRVLSGEKTIARVRVYLGPSLFGYRNAIVPVCLACLKRERRGAAEERACETCGRGVLNAYAGAWRARHTFCCGRCALDYYARRQREKRATARGRQRTCEACGRSFTPRRADAKYCPGGACKQDAYRKRKQGVAA